MKQSTHEYLRARRSPHRQPGEFLDGLPDISGDLSEIIEEAEFEAAQRIDPSLTRSMTLLARLSGNDSVNNGMSPGLAKNIIPSLTSEIESAAGKNSKYAKMKLVDLTPGSIVLHLKPETPFPEEEGSIPESTPSPAHEAIQSVMALHNMIEDRAEASIIASRFQGKEKLLKSASKLLSGLSEEGLDLSLRWWSPQGKRYYSAIGSKGRSYAKSLFEKFETSREVTITGNVVGLDIDGVIAVNPEGGGSKKKVRIDPEQLISYHFNLGDRISLRVKVVTSSDRVGSTSRDQYSFVSLHEQIEFPGE